MLVLIWVQTVCKGYQEMTKAAASKERVNGIFVSFDTISSYRSQVIISKIHCTFVTKYCYMLLNCMNLDNVCYSWASHPVKVCIYGVSSQERCNK